MVSQRKSDVMTFSSAIFLLLELIGLISGLQQSPTSTLFFRKPFSFQRQPTCLWSASVDETSSGEDQSEPSYDWDEQFEELQLFMSDYGHCNFPQNASKELTNKYPMLKRFCRDQRIEYKLLQQNKHEKMTLLMFDRDVRCRRLDELGFEFSLLLAPWYDRYHELIQYSSDNGHARVTEPENAVLSKWIYVQRSKRNGTKSYTRLPESQIKLLDDIGFEWKSERYDEIWSERYKELVAFRDKHGHLTVERADPLYSWMNYQRRRRAEEKGYAALTEEQTRLLDEIQFPWKPELHDSMWHAMYDELQQFQKKHGHCQPGWSTNTELYKWTEYQQKKHQQGRLSREQIELLEKIDFPFEFTRLEWPRMFGELTEYVNTHGHLQVGQDDDPGLYEWMTTQRKRYHGIIKPVMPDAQIEKLEEIHFCWSLDWRERTWHEKYTEAVEFSKEHGHVRVTKKENRSLYNWIQTQEKRYKEVKGQKPLSEEELELLEQLDFPFFEGQPRMAWNGMYAEVERYREENDGRFPTSHKDDADLSRWMRQQRHRYRQAYGYAPLSEEEKSLLESVDFPLYPYGKKLRSWYERYDELVEFRNQHGHFLVEKNEDTVLYRWMYRQRVRSNGCSATASPLFKVQAYLLERIGFTWASNRYEIEWQKNFDEVVEFLEIRGHFPGRSDNRELYRWIAAQRQRYKGNGRRSKLPEKQIQQLEKVFFRL